MTNRLSNTRRITILIGLVLTLVLPLLPYRQYVDHIPGIDPFAAREGFWWGLTGVVLLYVLAVERKSLTSIGLHRPNWKTFASAAAAVGAIFAGGAVLAAFAFPLLHVHPNAQAMQKMMELPYGYRVILVLRAAVAEEIFFRGYGIERLRELTGSKYVAGALTLAAFTIAHLSYWGWTQALLAGLAGLVLTILYFWRRDLGANMVAHFVTDAVGLLLH